MRRPLVLRRRFSPQDERALDGVVQSPVQQTMVFERVDVWDGTGQGIRHGCSVLVRDGRIDAVAEGPIPIPPGALVIDVAETTLLPGLIDAHVHMLYDSGPDLFIRGRKLIADWVELTQRYPNGRAPIVRRGQLKLKAGVTTVRILGDGYYALRYRDDVARWDVVGPRVLAAGLHVNGPNGYISGGIAARLPEADRALAAVEIGSIEEIRPKLSDHIARGIDVVKIATTHGDVGFGDAPPDLPEEWVRRIVELAHEHGLKVTAHSYGTAGDWAAIRGGVDGIEHLVNVPTELPDDMIGEIVRRGIFVCPTLSGSAYSVVQLLRRPQVLFEDENIASNVDAVLRRNLYVSARLLRNRRVAKLLFKKDDAMSLWEAWYTHSIDNTRRLHQAGARLLFGTDTPFTFGNFFHSIMNEVRALREAGIATERILQMATCEAATALGIADRLGTIEPGRVADLILVHGDPLSDVEALGRVRLVVKEGRVVYRGL